MLTKAFTTLRVSDYTPGKSSLPKISSPPHNPLDSFSEESVFQLDESPRVATHSSSLPMATFTAPFSDSVGNHANDTLAEKASDSGQQQGATHAPLRSYVGLGNGASNVILLPSDAGPWDARGTTSAPTTSSTLADEDRRSFRSSLSAVNMHSTMQALVEDEEYHTDPRDNAPNTECSFSRSASLPLTILPKAGGSMASAIKESDDLEIGLVPPSSWRRTCPFASSLSKDFCPPHEIVAASCTHSFAANHSVRRQSIADKIAAVVFEQTGYEPQSCRKGFCT